MELTIYFHNQQVFTPLLEFFPMGHTARKLPPVLGGQFLLGRSFHLSVPSLPSMVPVIVNAQSLSEHFIKISERILVFLELWGVHH